MHDVNMFVLGSLKYSYCESAGCVIIGLNFHIVKRIAYCISFLKAHNCFSVFEESRWPIKEETI